MSSTRYTKRDAEAAYERLRDALGKLEGSTLKMDDPKREGAWTLDHNSAYGGYCIDEYCADGPPFSKPYPKDQTFTAVSRPLGHERRNAREFCDVVHFAMRVLREAESR